MALKSAAQDKVRVAILGTTLIGRADLREGLEGCGLAVVVEETLTRFLSDIERHSQVDVILVDLEQAEDEDLDILDALVEYNPLPMVFHDVCGRASNPAWLRRLAEKLTEAAKHPPRRPRPPHAAQHMLTANVQTSKPRLRNGLRCWVLGASFGGPEALKRFLSAVPEVPTNTAFIIGQHIGDGFVEVMAAQLNRCTPFTVVPAAEGMALESGTVYVAPVRERLLIDDAGVIRLRPETEKLTYTPSIDRLMEEVAARFGANSGAIIFSGMGDDGSAGCLAIARSGGVVWTQDSASCAIDSMPVCARATGVVRHEGTPEQLAADMAKYLKEQKAQALA